MMSDCRLAWNPIVNPVFHCLCHMALEILLITGRHPLQAKWANNRGNAWPTLARLLAFSLSRSFRGRCGPLQAEGCAFSELHRQAQEHTAPCLVPEQPRSSLFALLGPALCRSGLWASSHFLRKRDLRKPCACRCPHVSVPFPTVLFF